MTALEYLQRYGKERATRVAEEAGIQYAFFSQCAYGHRRPSADTALKLITASCGEMTLHELLFPPKRAARTDDAGIHSV